MKASDINIEEEVMEDFSKDVCWIETLRNSF
jgi:hypothetical protein